MFTRGGDEEKDTGEENYAGWNILSVWGIDEEIKGAAKSKAGCPHAGILRGRMLRGVGDEV